MKKIILVFAVLLAAVSGTAQENLGYLLVSGIEDSRRFAGEYVRPATEGSIYNLSNGWYQSAEVKGPLGFELSVIGNASVGLDEHQTFVLNTAEYENLHFADGSEQKEVATLLGPSMGNEVYIDYEGERIAFALPRGIISSGAEMLPSAFLQARLGIFKGTELKARYVPRVNYADVEAGLFGGAIQHEISSWLPGFDALPVAIAGLVGYTQMSGSYEFTDQAFLQGENQELSAEIESWLFSAIVSTDLPVINFYGGLGYVTGSSETELLGSYSVIHEPTGRTLASVQNPFTLSGEANGFRANLGLSLKLGFVKLHADYNFQEYQTVTAGLHFGL